MTRIQPRSSSPRQLKKTRTNPLNNFKAWLQDNFRAESIYFYRLAGLTGFLVVFGLVMVLSSSSIDSLVANRDAYYIFSRQFLYALIGLALMLVIASLPVSFIRNRVGLVLMVGFALQLAVPFIGISVNGNTNWLSIAGFTLQPSEFLKLALIMYMGWFISNREFEMDNPQRVLYPLLAVGGGAVLLVMFGRDLGTAVIFSFIIFGTLLMAGAPGKILGRVALLAIGLAAAATATSASRMARITAWLNPGSASSDAFNWQFEHGTWALASGGIFGVGLGNSKMKWSWIPEVENDFIFAVIGEELGLIGAMVVIGMFALLIASLIRVMLRAQTTFARVTTLGVVIWILSQSAVNIAVVLGVLPVLGVPLPLISAGGSSLIATLAGIGLVLAFEKDNHRQPLRGVRR
ncbi:MAG: putative lipid II flippase FtsW [Actinobacteria bacterium]|uniref:peptidoglycan glycosyltransferase n=1 Tax=freshwater metagenome TaxID=449393 RepID=A0A6J6IYT3_9ZZZZ|nr:putative lipid II flippase FtsW [Actinomycetota bacterium]